MGRELYVGRAYTFLASLLTETVLVQGCFDHDFLSLSDRVLYLWERSWFLRGPLEHMGHAH